MDLDTFKHKLKDDESRPLSAKTITSYVAGLRRLERILSKNITKIDFTYTKYIFEKLKTEIDRDNSRKIVLISIVRYLGFTPLKDTPTYTAFVAEHNQIKQDVLKVEAKNELKPKEVDTFLDYQSMIKRFKEFVADKEERKRIEPLFLLGTLLLTEAPTRLGNYNKLEVVRVTGETYEQVIDALDYEANYLIVINTEKTTEYLYVFNKYKTANSIGTIHMKVDDPLLKELITLLLVEKSGKKYLFDFSTSYMTQLLRNITERIYGKAFSVDLIRHSFITWFFGTNPTTEEKIRRLKYFGNIYKPNQADLYLRILDKQN
jgi:hypothetical protein